MKYLAKNYTVNGMSKGCLSKKKFSEKTALKIDKQWDQRAYYCSLCFNWHLTKKKDAG